MAVCEDKIIAKIIVPCFDVKCSSILQWLQLSNKLSFKVNFNIKTIKRHKNKQHLMLVQRTYIIISGIG